MNLEQKKNTVSAIDGGGSCGAAMAEALATHGAGGAGMAEATNRLLDLSPLHFTPPPRQMCPRPSRPRYRRHRRTAACLRDAQTAR